MMNVGATADARARMSVNRSSPPVASSTEISTVTPQTIMMTRHGMIFTASISSPAFNRLSRTAPAKAPSPTSTSRKITPRMSDVIMASVVRCVRSNSMLPVPSPPDFESSAPVGTITAPS